MQLSPRAQAGADALFRVLFSGIFLVAALNHFNAPEVIVGRLVEAPLAGLATRFASAEALVHLSGVVMLVAGLALVLGLRTRLSAAVLAAMLVPITLTVHVGNPGHLGPLFKNVALFGGLIHFGTRGGGAFSLDALLAGARPRAARAGVAALLLAAGLGAWGAAPAHAQAPAAERGAVILVQNAQQVPVVLQSAAELAGDGRREVHVIACGPSLKALKDGPPLAAALKAKVRVAACGISLEKAGLQASDLPAGVTVVPNGIVEAVRLQDRGFVSVEL